jgi:hypothetical protein
MGIDPVLSRYYQEQTQGLTEALDGTLRLQKITSTQLRHQPQRVVSSGFLLRL